jgi:ribosome-binding ATPase YchF (GTP1/OBG family)
MALHARGWWNGARERRAERSVNHFMKIALFGLAEIKTGKHNLKDPRLDEADKLVEADKKTHAQVDLVGEDQLIDADAILVSVEGRADLILKDLEFVETRLGREPQEAERQALKKIQTLLEQEKFVFGSDLAPADLQAVAAHNFFTAKPVVVAGPPELDDPDALLLRAFREGGYICFLTVGGKENRAWPIRKGLTAWEAGGTIHTDIQKGFIRAEIISFADFIGAGGETQAKRAGKMRLETKQYVMQDCDITNFRFNK